MLGDAYGAAVVEALSKKEMKQLDGDSGLVKEPGNGGPDEEALIGIYKAPSTGSNGSSVKVREVQIQHDFSIKVGNRIWLLE